MVNRNDLAVYKLKRGEGNQVHNFLFLHSSFIFTSWLLYNPQLVILGMVMVPTQSQMLLSTLQ